MAEAIITPGCLYRLTFPNGKAYIGITSHTAEHRFSVHCSFAKGGKRLCAVHRAILKYGSDSVKIETLHRGMWPEVVAMESEAIVSFKTKYPSGYNLTDGGEGAVGAVRSEETKAKLSASKKGFKPTAENVQKLKEVNSKRFRSVEERAKLSASLTGRKFSADHIEKMRIASTGRTHSAEAKEKVSKANKGKLFSQETRDKIGYSKRGIKFSQEHISNMRKARTGVPLSAEALAIHRLTHLGRVNSEETRLKMSKAQTGRVQSAETIAKRKATQAANRLLKLKQA